MGGLADRTAAEEARFFRAEDELALRRRMEKFVSTNATAIALENSATSVGLNEFQRECLAASKRSMAKQTNVVSVKTHNPLKVDIDVEKLAGQAKLAHNTFVDYLKVPRVSMGRAKWEIHDDASVFSVADGKRLALSGPEETMALRNPRSVKVEMARQIHIENHKVDQSTYKGMRLYPKLNPGRAFLWGSLLAVWGTGFAYLAAKKYFRIHSMEDLDTFVNRSMQKPVENIKVSLTETLKPNKAEAEQYQQLQKNKFVDNLKSKWN